MTQGNACRAKGMYRYYVYRIERSSAWTQIVPQRARYYPGIIFQKRICRWNTLYYAGNWASRPNRRVNDDADLSEMEKASMQDCVDLAMCLSDNGRIGFTCVMPCDENIGWAVLVEISIYGSARTSGLNPRGYSTGFVWVISPLILQILLTKSVSSIYNIPDE